MTIIRALVLLALNLSSIAVAKDVSGDWSFLSERAAESVQIQAPKFAVSSRPAEVSVVIGLPSGCYKAIVAVEHKDAFTHVLRPAVRHDPDSCLQISRFDFQTVSLGSLQAGEHQVLVENVTRPAAPTTFRVTGDATAATH